MIVSLLCISSVFAGTLVAGSSVAVTSNNPDIGKLTLVGLWSTTPTANDKLIITNADLPKEYGLAKQLVIDVPQPTFEQVFSVDNQKPIYDYELFSSSIYITDYENKIMNEFKTKHPGASILTYRAASDWTGLTHNAYIIYVSKQQGWVGSTLNKGINYEQKVNLNMPDGSVKSLELIRNAQTDQLVDSISGVALARVAGFSSWTNGLLDTRNTYAYHANVDKTVGNWLPFNDKNQYYTAYVSSLTNLEQWGTKQASATSGSIQNAINSDIAAYRVNKNNLISFSTNFPADWSNKGSQSATRTNGNDIIVPLVRTALTANIQLILNGEKFGLFIPTGVPSIVSYDSSVTFSETGSGAVKYTVQNVGQSDGTFTVQLFCPDTKVVGEVDELLIKAGQSTSGNIRVTGKPGSTSDLSQTCKLTMTESTTKQKVEKNVGVTVQAKANCEVGQESAQYTSGAVTIVDTYDAKCNVVSSIKCNTATQDVKVNGGVSECVNKPQSNGGTGTFNTTLFAVSIIVGLVGVMFAYTPVKEFTFPMGKSGKYILWIVLGGIFLALALWVVPNVYKFFLSIFGV